MERISAPVSIDDIVGGKYAVQRILARGGAGVVVLARHLQLREPCAIKLLRSRALGTPQAKERFLREARALARLKSDHVVRVFDVGQLADGTPYMVMEHLDGADLEDILRERGRLPLQEAALYALQICSALAEVHRLGIVHRDLKPANLFLTRAADGSARIKLIDFGISKMLRDPDGVDPMKTQQGAVMGTPLYMAPEQVSGSPVDTRTDIWALGVVLYDLLTGHLPFQTDASPMNLVKILVQAPTPPSAHLPSIPPPIERLILRCLQKVPGARPADVGAIAAELAPFAGDDGEPLSRHVQRVLEGAPLPGPRPAPPPAASAVTTMLAAAPASTPPCAAGEVEAVEAPPRSSSRAGRLSLALAVGLAVAAASALALDWRSPGSASAPPPAATAIAPAVAPSSAAAPPPAATTTDTASPAASAPASRALRPPAASRSNGFDLRERR